MSATVVQRVLLAVLVSLLAAIGYVLLIDRGSAAQPAADPPPARFDGFMLAPGLRAANFSLLDQDGHRVTLSQYRGKVVVLTFIHSLCRNACPFMVEQIKGALNELPGLGRDVPAIGISVEPSQDTRAHRRWFIRQHEMTGRLAFLSGTVRQLRPIWHAYAIQQVTPHIDHSTFVMLIDKHGFERIADPAVQLTPDSLAHDIRVLEHER